MYGRPVTQAERLNMRLPPDLKRRLDRLAVTRDFEVRPLSIVARKALECGLQILEARRAELDSE
jgi:predicted transcriptional regulator